MTQADIDKLLAGRAIINAYQATRHTPSKDATKLEEDLKQLGFESIDAFYDFNKDAVMEALVEIGVEGQCDSCQGYTGTPMCQENWGSLSCSTKPVESVNPRKLGLFHFFLRRDKVSDISGVVSEDIGGTDPIGHWQEVIDHFTANMDEIGMYWFCPKGHGFYINVPKFDKLIKDEKSIVGKFSLVWG